LEQLKSFRQMGSVLYVAAHPDDENTQLITYLARGRGYRTAYLSVTRGDGGQNVLGPEFGEELGVIRTQELLAARRLDGGRQFFTRAIDFGFSKDSKETLNIWDRDQVVSDIVRVIRTFRPDVVITRFSPQPGGTHGHHTASAILAIEAFKLAGDPKAFPDQLKDLKPWQPKRILMNAPNFGRAPELPANSSALKLDINGTDSVTGESFSEIAARSRSMHKTQGFGNFTGFGGGRGGARGETFTLLGGDPATTDIMDGVDTTWGRVTGEAEVGKMADEVISKFDTNNPAASVPALLSLKKRLASLSGDSVVEEKRKQLDKILQGCLGLSVETVIPQAEVVPGEALNLDHRVSVQSGYPVRWVAVRYPDSGTQLKTSVKLEQGKEVSRSSNQILPAFTPLTQPYWLREEPTTGMYRVSDPSLIGRPENPPAYPIEQVFEVDGQRLVIPDEPVQLTQTAKGEQRRKLDVIAPVAVNFPFDVRLFAPGSTRPVEVELRALRPNSGGTVRLQTPSGWTASPESGTFNLEKVGDQQKVTFNVTAPSEPKKAQMTASAYIGGRRFDSQRIELRYDHIPWQMLQPTARLEAVSLDLGTRGRQVGYVPGAGDSVAECLEQMGYRVTRLNGSDLTPEKLKNLDAVVIGIRAFNVRTDLGEQMPALFAFAEAGGTVIEQYNRPNDLKTSKMTPYDLRISNDRVTDETAPMTLLVPDSPALTTPNKIVNSDFDGWVQERGLYFPNEWDEHFTPIIACNDPGESPKKGGLLVAKYGKGYFVYTGLAWFRQLPAGVPGAYRLFANLVSLGK
jgi:LmbE family N-acetylglucosaminyl deacetylase